jgi:hypothetical protein
MTRLAFALLLVFASHARAQDLFGVPGNPRLTPTGVTLPAVDYFGEDAAGYVYYAAGGIACHHPSTPDSVHLLQDGGFFDANGTLVGSRAFAALAPDGSGIDVAFVPLYPYWQVNREAVRLFRTSCAELAELTVGGAGAMRLGGTIMRSDSPLLARLDPRFGTSAGAGASPPATIAEPTDAGDALGMSASTPGPPPTFSQLVDARRSTRCSTSIRVAARPLAGRPGLEAQRPRRRGDRIFMADRFYLSGGAMVTSTGASSSASRRQHAQARRSVPWSSARVSPPTTCNPSLAAGHAGLGRSTTGRVGGDRRQVDRRRPA